jgi:CheY-like chemotaxis protein
MANVPPPQPPDPARPGADRANAAGPQVLIVDDEPGVRRTLALALERAGFGVRLAGGGLEAVAVYREHGQGIDLVLLDVLMPGMDGPATLAALQAINPAVRCCFMSGHTAHYPIHQLLALGALDLVFKPFANLTELRETLRALVPPSGQN